MCRLIALIVSLVACGLSSVAIAQPTLSQPVDLSTSVVNSVDLVIALSSDGTRATAVWREPASNGKNQVKSSSATIAGAVASWGPVTTLSSDDSSANSVTVQLSSDGSQALAIWQATKAQNVAVIQTRAATISGNTASWGTATQLPSTTAQAVIPRIALSADGTRAFVVWARFAPSSTRSSCGMVVGSSVAISGNALSLGSVQPVSEQGGCIEELTVSMSASGGVVTAAWSSIAPNRTNIVRARTATVNGTTASWGSISDLSAPSFYSRNAAVAVSADGTKVTAVWARALPEPAGRESPILVRSRSATITGNAADWGATTVLSATTDRATQPLVGISSDGTSVTASWIRTAKTAKGVYAVESSSATVAGNVATWGSPTSVSGDAKVIIAHSLSVSPDGSKALSTWSRAVSKVVVQSATGVLSGTIQLWGSPFDISDPTQQSSGPGGKLSADGALGVLGWHQNIGNGKFSARARVAEFTHPTPTATPVATNTPTATPTPAPTTTPVGTLSPSAPIPTSFSNDHYVVLRIKDYPTSYRRDYYGYLLRASDHSLVKMGKYKVRNHQGRLEFHDVPPGVYRTFTVIIRSKSPKIVSSRQRTIVVN